MHKDPLPAGYAGARITCVVHERLSARVAERLAELGARTVLVEKARTVRQRYRRRRFPLLSEPGWRLDDAPTEIFRTTVPRVAAPSLIGELAAAAELNPGRGAIYAQDIVEYSPVGLSEIRAEAGPPARLLQDLALVTVILSMSGSGDRLARSALSLGACVPVVSLGLGTGIRDRLGLLRITIPPEKDVVHLMLPRHDAAAIERLLIEDAGMDRPGGGFLYRTAIRAGLVDPLLRIGRQDRAASIEQIVAALDELKSGTAWRRRWADPGRRHADPLLGRRTDHREIVFVCPEGEADRLVRAAMRAGAGGATTARVRCLGAGDMEGGIAARERGVICVPASDGEGVISALQAVGHCHVQALEAPSVFSHTRVSAG